MHYSDDAITLIKEFEPCSEENSCLLHLCIDAIGRLVKIPLRQGQVDALMSFVFNLGVSNFEASVLLNKINVGDCAGAAEEFKKWSSCGGDWSARRAAEEKLFRKEMV